jgi:hypothetical protein
MIHPTAGAPTIMAKKTAKKKAAARKTAKPKPTSTSGKLRLAARQEANRTARKVATALFRGTPETAFCITVKVGWHKRAYACENKALAGAKRAALKYYRECWPGRELTIVDARPM